MPIEMNEASTGRQREVQWGAGWRKFSPTRQHD